MIGVTSGATALIATVIKFREGADLIAEIDVDADSVTGTFVTGESVTTTDTTLDLEISAVVKGIVTGGTVTTGGAYYSTGDSVHVTGGAGNNAATARVGSAGAGNIDEILIESGGSGYSIGEELRFTLTNTEGTDVRAKITVVGGGISLEPDTAPDALMMENEDFIVTDDEVKFISQEQTVGELDHLTLEDGGQIIIEEATFTDIATNQSATAGQPHFDAYGFHNASIANEIGEITSIEMINKGNGFIKLPLVLDSATTTGSGASLFAVSNKTPMVGNVEGIEVTNFGFRLHK